MVILVVLSIVIISPFMYYWCMRIYKYLFSNLSALCFYFLIFLTIHVFVLQNLHIKLYTNVYITLEQYSAIYLLLTILAFIFLILFVIEIFLSKKFLNFLPQIDFKNKHFALLHKILFFIAFIGNFLNFLFLFCMYYLLIGKI